MAILRSKSARIVRNALLRLIDCLPPVKQHLALDLSGLSRKALSQVDRNVG
jgi:hypothetical protein